MEANITTNCFKDNPCEFSEHLRILADAGYQGLMELHENKLDALQEIQISCSDKTRKKRVIGVWHENGL